MKNKGVEILKEVSTKNLNNEEIMTLASDIIWHIISINDKIDSELIQNFVEENGNDAVVEVLLTKDKDQSTKKFVEIVNGMAQVPQIMQKLIESGILETVKLVNDLYIEDTDIISVNVDTMKRITSNRAGREAVLRKNLIPNVLKNISTSSQQENTSAVMSGLSIIDNLTKSDEGKKALRENNTAKEVSEVLNQYKNNQKVIQMGVKCYSKISEEGDIKKEMTILVHLNKQEKIDLKEVEKSITLTSNYLLFDDHSNKVNETDNRKVLIDVFQKINTEDDKAETQEKREETAKAKLSANGKFMLLFNRLFQNKSANEEDKKTVFNIVEENLKKNWENAKKILGFDQSLKAKKVEKEEDTDDDDEEEEVVRMDYLDSFKEIKKQRETLIRKK
jgi:hypothetical protein